MKLVPSSARLILASVVVAATLAPHVAKPGTAAIGQTSPDAVSQDRVVAVSVKALPGSNAPSERCLVLIGGVRKIDWPKLELSFYVDLLGSTAVAPGSAAELRLAGIAERGFDSVVVLLRSHGGRWLSQDLQGAYIASDQSAEQPLPVEFELDDDLASVGIEFECRQSDDSPAVGARLALVPLTDGWGWLQSGSAGGVRWHPGLDEFFASVFTTVGSSGRVTRELHVRRWRGEREPEYLATLVSEELLKSWITFDLEELESASFQLVSQRLDSIRVGGVVLGVGGKPLPGAQVALGDGGLVATSDVDGRWSAQGVLRGFDLWWFTISHPGFNSKRVKLSSASIRQGGAMNLWAELESLDATTGR